MVVTLTPLSGALVVVGSDVGNDIFVYGANSSKLPVRVSHATFGRSGDSKWDPKKISARKQHIT
jgi:hypothetical protein